MERLRRIRGFQVKSDRVEKEKLESSHDFSEITLAITLLAGVMAFLLKLIDYFNNNIITISDYLQVTAYFLVCLLLFELSMIFLFLILKGYLMSTKYKIEKLKYITQDLFKYIFIIPILWIVISISTLFFDQFFKDASETTLYGYLILTCLVVIL